MDGLAPNVQVISWLLLGIFALSGGINQVMSIIDRWKGKPPSGELFQGHNLLSVRVDSMESDLKDLEHRVEQQFDAMEDSSEKRAVALHTRINPIEAQIGKLSGTLESTTQMLARIDSKIDRLSERISK